MSDELERRLREAGHRLPDPTDLETGRARGRVLAARPRRRLLPALAAAIAVAGAFGVGYAVAAGNTVTKTVVVEPRLQTGPGFLPAPGWAVTGSDDAASATSGNGTRIEARFSPASRHPAWPQRLLPLRLPANGHVEAHVGAYAVEVTIALPPHPNRAVLAAARVELGRLVVPSCPAAQPLASASGAVLFIRHWLPSHYPGSPRDLVGGRASGTLGRSMPRYGEAEADCDRLVASRSVEVDVTLPRVAKVSASLSELTYFVAKTAGGWTVWERAR